MEIQDIGKVHLTCDYKGFLTVLFPEGTEDYVAESSSDSDGEKKAAELRRRWNAFEKGGEVETLRNESRGGVEAYQAAMHLVKLCESETKQAKGEVERLREALRYTLAMLDQPITKRLMAKNEIFCDDMLGIKLHASEALEAK